MYSGGSKLIEQTLELSSVCIKLTFVTGSNFKGSHPLINDSLMNKSLIARVNFDSYQLINVVSSVMRNNSKINSIFLMHLECINIVVLNGYPTVLTVICLLFRSSNLYERW